MLDNEMRLIADHMASSTEPPDEIDVFTNPFTVTEAEGSSQRCPHTQRGTGDEADPTSRLHELRRWAHVERIHDPLGTSATAVAHADPWGDDSDPVIIELRNRSFEPSLRRDAVGIQEGDERSLHVCAPDIASGGWPLVHCIADQRDRVTRTDFCDDLGDRFWIGGTIVHHDGGRAHHTADRLSQSDWIVEDGNHHRDVRRCHRPGLDHRMRKPPAHEELCMRGFDPAVTIAFQGLHRIQERRSDDLQPPRAAASNEFTPTPRSPIPADVN